MAHLTLKKQHEIENRIENLRLNLGLSYPENSLLDIAKNLGLKVYEIDLSAHPGVNGVIKYNGEVEGTAIYLNAAHSPVRKTFTLAHEIGHFLLHNGREKLRVDKFDYRLGTDESLEETEANYFASCLLVPKDKLDQLVKMVGQENISSIADYFGVSIPVIQNRLKWIQMNQPQI